LIFSITLKTYLPIHIHVLSRDQEVPVKSLQLWEHFVRMDVYIYVGIFLKPAFFSPQRRLEAAEKNTHKFE